MRQAPAELDPAVPGSDPINGTRLHAATSDLFAKLASAVTKLASAAEIVSSPLAADGTSKDLQDDPLVAWRSSARRTLIAVAVFSTFVNLMMLTLPLYLFQLSDRVLTSRSLDTLLMLTIVALGLYWRSVTSRHYSPASAWPIGHKL